MADTETTPTTTETPPPVEPVATKPVAKLEDCVAAIEKAFASGQRILDRKQATKVAVDALKASWAK